MGVGLEGFGKCARTYQRRQTGIDRDNKNAETRRLLIIICPGLKNIVQRFDRLVGHYRRYHRNELGQVLATVGINIVSNNYCDVLGVLPCLILNRFFGSTELSSRLANLYDFIGITVTLAVGKIMPLAFGKNIILIARRPFGSD